MSDLLARRQPDYRNFLAALDRKAKPARLPFYEHIANMDFIEKDLGRSFAGMTPNSPEFFDAYIAFWKNLGFDVVPIEHRLLCPILSTDGHGTMESEKNAVIRDWESFERYEWPDPKEPIPIDYFENLIARLPEGMKLVAGVGRGPYEWVSTLMGVQGMSMALFEQPDLVEAMFQRIGELILEGNRRLAALDGVCALRQGDDLGFKTATFLSPDQIRHFVLPWYQRLAENAHAHGKPFILHSCGNLEAIYEDLIDCGIDGKHSFEDVILPVVDFKQRWGDRLTPLGGLDVDKLCQGSEPEIRAYTRKVVEACWESDGHFALGTGNSLTEYLPPQHYRWALDEALSMTGA